MTFTITKKIKKEFGGCSSNTFCTFVNTDVNFLIVFDDFNKIFSYSNVYVCLLHVNHFCDQKQIYIIKPIQRQFLQ